MEKLKKMNLVINRIDPKTVQCRNDDGLIQSDKRGSLCVSIPRDKLRIKEDHLLPPAPRKSGRKLIRKRMPDGMLMSFPKKNSKNVFIDFNMGLLSQNSNCQNNNPPSIPLFPSFPLAPPLSLPTTPPSAVPPPCSLIPSSLSSSPPHSCPTLPRSQRSHILKRNSVDSSHTSISKPVFHSNSVPPVSVKKAPLSQKRPRNPIITVNTNNNDKPLRARKRPLRRPRRVLDSSSDNESKDTDQERRPLTEPMSDVPVVLPVVYSDPFPSDSHTPIIITHSSHNDVTLDDSEGICIQENVDNVLCNNGEIGEQVESEPLNVAVVDRSDPMLKMEDMIFEEEELLLKDEECVYSDIDVFDEVSMLLNDTPSCDLSQETPLLFHNTSLEVISPPISDVPAKTSKDIPSLLTPTEISANNILPLPVNDTPIKSPIKTPPLCNKVLGEDTLPSVIKTGQEPQAQTPNEAISEVNDTAEKNDLQTSQDCKMTSSSLDVNKTIINNQSMLSPPTVKRRVKVRLKERSPSCVNLIVKEARETSPIFTAPQQINPSSGVLLSTNRNTKFEKTKTKVSLSEKSNNKISSYSKGPTAKMVSKESYTKPLLCNESVAKPLISEEPKMLSLSHLQFDEMESKHQKRIISFLKSSAAVMAGSTISTSSSIEPPAKRPRQIESFKEPPAIKSSDSFSFNYDVIKKEKPNPSDDFTFNVQTTCVFGNIPKVFGKTTPTNSAQDVIAIDDDDVISLLPADTLDPSPSKHNEITSSDNINPNFKQDQIHSWVAQQQRYPAPPPPGGMLATSPHWLSMHHTSRHRNSPTSTQLSVSPRQELDFNMLRLPTSRISPSNLCDYLYGYDQLSVAERHFHEILTLLRAIMHCDYATAGDHYLCLRVHNAVHFDANVLTALLQLCSDQHYHDLSPKPPFVAHEVFNDLKSLGKGRVALLDHLNMLRTLIHYQLYSEVTKCYESAPSLDVQITPSHLELMLQAAGGLGPHAMRLLEDATQCLHVKELARYVEDLVSKLDKHIIAMYIQQFENWVKHNPEVVLKFSRKTLQILLNVFVESDCWMGGASLLESSTAHIPVLGSLVVKLVGGILQHCHKGIHQLMNFIKHLSPDQCKLLNEEYWEMLLGFSVQLNLINTSHWLFKTARELYHPISKQVQFQLLCLFIEQDCPKQTTEVLKVFLAVPLPSSTYLINLCARMKNQLHFALHLYSVCLALLELNITPPPDCLDWLLEYHSKHEKVYSWLAELIKQASQHKIQFEHEFYENTLIQLRSWGKDGEAVSCVYKNLRKTVQSPLSDRRDDIGLDSSSGVGSSPEFFLDSSNCGLNFSLEGTLHHNSKKESTSSLCSLIKQSGLQGQFVAVSAILSNLPTTAYYNNQILRSTLSAVLHSPLKPVQAFVNLVSSLKSNSDNNILSSHNLWLAGQVGVALLCRCEQSGCWNEGFILLHCLHLHGIHYVGVSPPHALDPPPSPCTVALKAVTICLKVRQLSGVMEVLKGCQFIPSENEKETQAREDMLFTLVGEYEKEEHFTHAFICLESAIRSLSSVYYTRVSRTTSSLLTTMLDKGYMIEKATDVLKTLLDKNVVLSCEVFSRFISKLISNGNESQARNLCQSAIEGGWYHVAGTTPYCLVLPCILSSIEVYLLVHHHLNQQPRPSLRDLEIICPSGLRATVETCLSLEFTPPLSITGRSARPSSNVALLVSTLSLSSWYLAHSPSMSENSDKKKTFKRIVCKKVVEELKPYYSNQRFDSVEAYRHLINVIYLHCSKEGKHTNWTVTKEILVKVRSVVNQVMDSISTYGLNTDLSTILSAKCK